MLGTSDFLAFLACMLHPHRGAAHCRTHFRGFMGLLGFPAQRSKARFEAAGEAC